MLAQLESYKDRIPEFIIKLYHILEQNEYSEWLCWQGDSQICIRNVRKLEERVLPQFFRHKHVSSFVRQLNMYRFSKVNKLTKERNVMYFRNENFKRGQIKLLTKIKRNHKSSREDDPQNEAQSVKSENISLNRELQINTALNEYKNYVKTTVGQLIKAIKRLETAHPETKCELTQAVSKCHELIQAPLQATNSSFLNLDESLQNKNMMSTMRLLPPIEPILFSSQCSFFHIN